MRSEQFELPLPRETTMVDHKLIEAQPSLLAAIKLCITLGGLAADKEVYMPLAIDAGHWSRILRGEAHFPVDKLPALMDLCGNEAPMLWLLRARGYDATSLRKLETETERQLRQAQDRIRQLELEREVELRLISRLKVA